MKKFIVRGPFFFAILVSLIAIFSQAWPFWLSGLSLSTQIIAGRLTGCLIAVVLLSVLGWWREAGFIHIYLVFGR